MQRVLVTGSAGFIGFHLSQLLLQDGFEVLGYDALTDYYDVSLKTRRNLILNQHQQFTFIQGRLEDQTLLEKISADFQPQVIVHLAGQAGVRYSLEDPRSYVDSNIVGTFNIMEIARMHQVQHLLMASTSSAYGANEKMPFQETDPADHPLTLYAASKRANEAMAHSYAHLWKIPTTLFRFFTVYGPWGRPDMALFKFVAAMLDDEPIDIYNRGQMTRDFTYVTDLVRAIRLLMDTPPPSPGSSVEAISNDSLSPVAPYRLVNIGNGTQVSLMDFIEAIERSLGIKAKRNYMEMQKGDVPATWADTSLLNALTGYTPETDVREGVGHFVNWYRDYYRV